MIYVVLIQVIKLVNNCILAHFQVYNTSMHEHAQSFDIGNSEGFGFLVEFWF